MRDNTCFLLYFVSQRLQVFYYDFPPGGLDFPFLLDLAEHHSYRFSRTTNQTGNFLMGKFDPQIDPFLGPLTVCFGQLQDKVDDPFAVGSEQ